MADEQLVSSDPNFGLKKAADDTPKGHDFKVLGVNIHVPGEDKPRLDSNMVGIGTNGAGVAPEDALMGGQAVRAVAKAVTSGGALAGVGEALAQATPIVKYETTKAALTAIGVPGPLASVAAAMVSGYKSKGKAPAAAEVPTEGAHLDRSVAVPAGSLTQEQLAQRVRFGSGTPPPRPGKQPPIAAVAPPEPIVPAAEPVPASVGAAAAKPSLTAAESKEYLKLRAAGKTDAQAKTVIETSRALNASLGLSTPTAAETKFPKGMRGGAPK